MTLVCLGQSTTQFWLLPNAVHMLCFSKRMLFYQQETLSSSIFFCLRQVEHVISVLQTHVIRVPF